MSTRGSSNQNPNSSTRDGRQRHRKRGSKRSESLEPGWTELLAGSFDQYTNINEKIVSTTFHHACPPEAFDLYSSAVAGWGWYDRETLGPEDGGQHQMPAYDTWAMLNDNYHEKAAEKVLRKITTHYPDMFVPVEQSDAGLISGLVKAFEEDDKDVPSYALVGIPDADKETILNLTSVQLDASKRFASRFYKSKITKREHVPHKNPSWKGYASTSKRSDLLLPFVFDLRGASSGASAARREDATFTGHVSPLQNEPDGHEEMHESIGKGKSSLGDNGKGKARQSTSAEVEDTESDVSSEYNFPSDDQQSLNAFWCSGGEQGLQGMHRQVDKEAPHSQSNKGAPGSGGWSTEPEVIAGPSAPRDATARSSSSEEYGRLGFMAGLLPPGKL